MVRSRKSQLPPRRNAAPSPKKNSPTTFRNGSGKYQTKRRAEKSMPRARPYLPSAAPAIPIATPAPPLPVALPETPMSPKAIPASAPVVPVPASSVPVDDDGNQLPSIVITEADTIFESTPYKGIKCTRTISVFKHSMKICQGNICDFSGSAIVNAANEAGLGGGGVDGAITKAGGPALHEARKQLPEIEPGKRILTGTAVLTVGGALPTKHVIHTVGPIFPDVLDPTVYEASDKVLKKAYKSSLKIAAREGFSSISFPLICGGVFRGKRALDMVIKIGWNACFKFLKRHKGRKMTICFVSFSDSEGHILRALGRATPHIPCSFAQRLCG